MSREAWARGGVECGRMEVSTRSAGIGGGTIGRRGCGAAIMGRDDEGGGPTTNLELGEGLYNLE